MSEGFHYESILESISGGFFALDDQYRITYWNKAAEAGTRLTSTEVLGKRVFDVFPNAEGAIVGEHGCKGAIKVLGKCVAVR